ncbi:MAG: energy-coupled thiamine transporter ThiT [Firmicutes bacterium]|nr:energy-coupled thiamine transporter ThiT [Bacillota bacterium]MCL2256412.1 energy-coupled thiamine transporter ThiT [Bacillota bacterium]
MKETISTNEENEDVVKKDDFFDHTSNKHEDDDNEIIAPTKERGFRNKHLRAITYGAICLALSFALSFVGFRMPMGGMISLGAIVPIVIFVYLFGFKYGIVIVVANTILRTVTGSTILGFGQVVLDYVIPMMALIIISLVPKLLNPKNEGGKFFELGVYVGIGLFAIIRWVSQTLSGIIYFDAPLGFSLLYNSFGLVDATIAAIILVALFRSTAFVRELQKIQALQHDMIAPSNEAVKIVNKKSIVTMIMIWVAFIAVFLTSSAFFRRDIEPLNAEVERHQATMEQLEETVPNWNLRRTRGSENETARLENVLEHRIAWLGNTDERLSSLNDERNALIEQIETLEYRISQLQSDEARALLAPQLARLNTQLYGWGESRDIRLAEYQAQIVVLHNLNTSRLLLIAAQYGLDQNSDEFNILQSQINNTWRWHLRQYDPYRFNDRTLRPARSHRNQVIWSYIGTNLFFALLALGVTIALEKRSVVGDKKVEKVEEGK